jgi:hypothetical protein
MVVTKRTLGLVSATIPLIVSIAYGQSSSITSLEPAATVVPEDTAAGAPLLEVEKVQLTEAVIERLHNDEATAEVADLFEFADGAQWRRRAVAQCKTFPGDSLWPADWIWNIFDLLLGKALIPTVPIAAPCYDSEWGPKDQAKCDAIVSSFTQPLTQYVSSRRTYDMVY